MADTLLPPPSYNQPSPVTEHLHMSAQIQKPVLAPENVTDLSSERSVRVATLNDKGALVDIELSAYADVYGRAPTEAEIISVQQKYDDRLSLLGNEDLILVVEDEDGPYGMIVCCTTNKGARYFLGDEKQLPDMTDSGVLKSIYDPNGINAYIVNLAVAPGHGRNSASLLIEAAKRMGQQRGVQKVFFESRIPGFMVWYHKQITESMRTEQPIWDSVQAREDLAEIYIGLKRKNSVKPVDPLLNFYVTQHGAQPLSLIHEAWKPDLNSDAKGVLCQIVLSEPDQNLFVQTLEYARSHPGETLTAVSAAVLAAFIGATGHEHQILESLGSSTWAQAYWATLKVYVGVMGAGAIAGTVNRIEHFSERAPRLRALLPESAWSRIGRLSKYIGKQCIKLSAVPATAAAFLALGAVQQGLPEGTARNLGYGLVAGDLFSTIGLRYAALKALARQRDKRKADPQEHVRINNELVFPAKRTSAGMPESSDDLLDTPA